MIGIAIVITTSVKRIFVEAPHMPEHNTSFAGAVDSRKQQRLRRDRSTAVQQESLKVTITIL